MRTLLQSALFGLLIALAACAAHAQETRDFTVRPDRDTGFDRDLLTIPFPDFERPRTTFSTGIPIELGNVSITPRVGLRKPEPTWLIPDDAREGRRAFAVELSYRPRDESRFIGFVAGMLGLPQKDAEQVRGFSWSGKVGSLDEAEVQIGGRYRF